jgi:hypothetical protein
MGPQLLFELTTARLTLSSAQGAIENSKFSLLMARTRLPKTLSRRSANGSSIRVALILALIWYPTRSLPAVGVQCRVLHGRLRIPFRGTLVLIELDTYRPLRVNQKFLVPTLGRNPVHTS